MVLPSIGGNLPAGIILTHPAPRLARPVHRRGAGAKTVNGRGKRLGLIGISVFWPEGSLTISTTCWSVFSPQSHSSTRQRRSSLDGTCAGVAGAAHRPKHPGRGT